MVVAKRAALLPHQLLQGAEVRDVGGELGGGALHEQFAQGGGVEPFHGARILD